MTLGVYKYLLSLVDSFFDGDDNNALTHSLVTNICEYFLLPTTTSPSPGVSCNDESIFSIPVSNNLCFFTQFFKSGLEFN